MKYFIKGIITVLNTPFTVDDQIDISAVRKNVNNALDAGVAGFLVPAMASEVEKLSESERLTLVKTVLEQVGNRVPVIGGASAESKEKRLQIAGELVDLGCDGILLNIPYRNDRQYEKEVYEIAKVNPGFLMLQDWDFGGFGIPVPLVKKLFTHVDVFRCFKIEVVPAGLKYTEVLEATAGKLHVSGGWAVMQFIEALDRGVHAFMPTGMHEIYTSIYSLYQKGRRDEAIRLFEKIVPVLAFSNQHLDISIHFFKRLLYKQGVFSTPRVREPILPFDEYHKRIADNLIDKVQQITKEIG